MIRNTNISHGVLYVISLCIIAVGIALLLFSPNPSSTKVKILTPLSGSRIETVEKKAEVFDLENIPANDVYKKIADLKAQGSYDAALQIVVSYEQQEPDKKRLLEEKADILSYVKKWKDVEEVYKTLASIEPKNSIYPVKSLEATLHSLQKEQFEQALKNAQERLPKFAQSPERIFLACVLAVYLNNENDVKTHCTQAQENKLTDTTASYAHDFVEHYAVFSTFKDGSGAYLRVLQAKTLTDAGYSTFAIHLLKEVVETQKEYRDAWTLLGYNYLLIDESTLALAALETAYTLDTSKAYVQYLLALAHDRLGNREKAISYYGITLSNQFEKTNEVRQRLAELYVENKNYQLAAEQFELLFQAVPPKNPEQYARLLWIYIEQLKDPKKAVDIALRAQKAFPGSSLSDNYVGWAYLAQGEYVKATEALDRGLARDPKLAPLYLTKARVEKAQGNLESAQKQYLKAYELAKGTEIGDLAGAEYNALLSSSS